MYYREITVLLMFFSAVVVILTLIFSFILELCMCSSPVGELGLGIEDTFQACAGNQFGSCDCTGLDCKVREKLCHFTAEAW